jgi:hypothetical protein
MNLGASLLVMCLSTAHKSVVKTDVVASWCAENVDVCKTFAENVDLDPDFDGMVDSQAYDSLQLCAKCSADQSSEIADDIAEVRRESAPMIHDSLWIDNCLDCGVPTASPTSISSNPLLRIYRDLNFELNFISENPRYMQRGALDQDVLTVLQSLILRDVDSPENMAITCDNVVFVSHDVEDPSEQGMLELDDDGESLYEGTSFARFVAPIRIRMKLTESQFGTLISNIQSEGMVGELAAGIDSIRASAEARPWDGKPSANAPTDTEKGKHKPKAVPSMSPSMPTDTFNATFNDTFPAPANLMSTDFSMLTPDEQASVGGVPTDDTSTDEPTATMQTTGKEHATLAATATPLASRMPPSVLAGAAAVVSVSGLGLLVRTLGAHRQEAGGGDSSTGREESGTEKTGMALTPSYIMDTL